MNAVLRSILLLQSGYYLVTGVWSLVSIGTFQAVTGPKTDLWLVKMVGLLVVVIGVTIGCHASRSRRTPELLVLSLGSIAAFTVIDTYYALNGTIAPVYLADAVLEVLLALAIILTWSAPPRT